MRTGRTGRRRAPPAAAPATCRGVCRPADPPACRAASSAGPGLQLRDAEVEHLPPAGGRAHDVLRLQVAMHDLLAVRGPERAEHGDARPRSPPMPAAAPGRAARAAWAREALFDDVQLVAFVDERVDGRDVRMPCELRQQLRFVFQPATVVRIGRDRWLQRLDGDLHVECGVAREVHHAHAAGGDQAIDGVPADLACLAPAARARLRAPGASSRRARRLSAAATSSVMSRVRLSSLPQSSRISAGRRAGSACSTRMKMSLMRGAGFRHAVPTSPGWSASRSALVRRVSCTGPHASRAILSGRACLPWSSRSSQAFASVHRRLTVAGDDSSSSAVSSTVRPPKNRSSTMRASSGSCCSSRPSTSSSASSSIGRSPPGRSALVERDAVSGAAALRCAMCARALHEDLPHRVGGDAHEVGPVLHVETTRAHEPRPGLVRERRRLQGVALSLVPHLAVRDAAQLVVHERRQLVQRVRVALPRRREQSHDRVGVGGGHRRIRPPDVRDRRLRILPDRDRRGKRI